jgi:polar amino acid transport system permease protein
MNPIQSFLKHYNGAAVLKYWHAPLIIQGIVITIVLAILAQLTGTIIGLVLYFMRRARFKPIGWIAESYIWLFRGTPLLVQVLAIYLATSYLNLARPLQASDIFPAIGFDQSGYAAALRPFVAGFLALALNEGAYMAEIVRAGIDSIDSGQMEAAKSLGMTYWLGMRRIVLPQAMRVILPPLGNEFNSMLKNTSLVSVISLYDLLGAAQAIGSPSFLTLELLTIASFWYLVMTTVWTIIQAALERRFNASNIDPGGSGKSLWARLLTPEVLFPMVRRSPVGGR